MEVCSLDAAGKGILIQYQGLHILCDYHHHTATTRGTNEENEEKTNNNTLGFDPASIDVVLVSSHESLPSLVHLCEYTTFTGVVYATQATVMLGRGVLVSVGCEPNDIDQCLRKCTSISYGDDVHLRHLSSSLSVCAVPSGYALGAANWVLKSVGHRVVVLGASSLDPDRHPAPMNVTALANADTLIVRGDVVRAHERRQAEPSPLDNMCAFVQHELLRPPSSSALGPRSRDSGGGGGGGVVVVRTPWCTGLVYDVLLALASVHASTDCSVLFCSDVAQESLSYANALPEWMAPKQQARVFYGQLPLDFTHVRAVAVASLPSPVPRNTVVVCTAGTDIPAAEHASVAMEPPFVDVRISPVELTNLLHERLKPRQLLVCDGRAYNATITAAAHRLGVHVPCQIAAPTYETAVIDASLVGRGVASTVITTHSGRRFRCARVRGQLQRHDRRFRVVGLTTANTATATTTTARRCWGTVTAVDVVAALRRHAFTGACLRPTKVATTTMMIVDVPSAGGAEIHLLSPGRTRIVCSSADHRARLQHAIVIALQTI